MHLLLLLILLLLATGGARADGIPLSDDLRRVTENHTTFILSPDQQVEVETRRQLTLTEAQLRVLRALQPRTPRVLPVVSSRHNDCTCDMGPTAVWCRSGEVDVPHFLLEQVEDEDPSPSAEAATEDDESQYITRRIITDSAGRAYHEGQPVPDEQLEQLLSEMQKQPSRNGERYLSLLLPPPANRDVEERVGMLVRRLKTSCEKYGINLFATG